MVTSRDTGVATVEVTTTADRLLVVSSRPSENGDLVSMVVLITDGTPQTGQLYIEAGIMRGEQGDPFKVAVLVSGYLYFGNAMNWLGKIPLDPTDRLYLEARGAEVYTIRLNSLIVHEVGE